MWADDVRLLRPSTYNWHFVDIPYDAKTYDPARDCKESPKGDCVVEAIQRLRRSLADPSKTRKKRAEAFMFLAHFVGDIHQPLHCAERNGDRGGNAVSVMFFGQSTNLHKVWGSEIIDRRVKDRNEYLKHLEQDWFPENDIAALEQGEPADWALETHRAAVDVAYALPEDLNLAEEYYERSLSTVERQLAVWRGSVSLGCSMMRCGISNQDLFVRTALRVNKSSTIDIGKGHALTRTVHHDRGFACLGGSDSRGHL
jgi:nuclease S1